MYARISIRRSELEKILKGLAARTQARADGDADLTLKLPGT